MLAQLKCSHKTWFKNKNVNILNRKNTHYCRIRKNTRKRKCTPVLQYGWCKSLIKKKNYKKENRRTKKRKNHTSHDWTYNINKWTLLSTEAPTMTYLCSATFLETTWLAAGAPSCAPCALKYITTVEHGTDNAMHSNPTYTASCPMLLVSKYNTFLNFCWFQPLKNYLL